MQRARIGATGFYVPDRIVTNDDLAKLMDTSDEWIRQRSGIERRRYAPEDVGCAELAYQASLRALNEAGLEANLAEETGATSEETAPPSGDDQLPAEEGTRPAEEEAVSEPEDEGTNDPAKDEPAEADEPDSSTK